MKWYRFQHADGYCGRCLKQVVAKRRVVDHRAHALMTLLCLGLWLPRWLREARGAPEPWRCCACHAEIFKLMAAVPDTR